MKRKYKDRKRQKTDARTVHTRDSSQNPLTRTGSFMPNALEATQYPLTRFTWDWQTINSLYRSHWIVRRIIDTIPADMVKNGYKILSQMAPDAIQKIQRTEKRTRTTAKILEGMKLGRLYGGAGALIMIKGQYDELDQPLELDSIMPGDYKGLLVLDRWSGITPEMDLVSDLDDPEFGLPNYYRVSSDSLDIGVKVHHSRIIRFMGRPLPYIEQLAETYWGASELEHVIDELRKRDNVSWNIAMLTFMANLRVMKMEGMSQILATGSQQAQQDLYNVIQGMNAMMNNSSMQILGENDSFETHQYTFGGIAETYDRFMMDVAGAAETPVTKLFGRSPAGMNSTGESDMQNYYDTIEEKQESELRPIYDKLLPIMCMSTLGAVPDDLDFDFNAVRRPNEDEMSDLASKNTDSVTKAFQAGLISQRTALKELRSQSEITGMWTNITDEDIEKADETIQDPNEGMDGMGSMFDESGEGGNSPENGEKLEQDKPQRTGELAQNKGLQRTNDAWEENKHPRKSNGQFGRGETTKTRNLNKSGKCDNVENRKIQQIGKELRTLGLLHSGETVENPDHIKITDINDHARERMNERHITLQMAQDYVDHALIKIRQSKDKAQYLAEDGTSIVVESGRLITSFTKAEYDIPTRRKVEVAKNG